MLFCKKCQVEHEEDKRFCPQCGSFLIRKEVLLEAEEPEKTEEDKPREKFICPNCKIIYEKTKKCIRCGAEVILLQHNEPPEQAEASETPDQTPPLTITKNELETLPAPMICPACKKEHLGGKSCIRCGTPLVHPNELQGKGKSKPPSPLEDKKADEKTISLTEVEKQLFQEESTDQLPRKRSVQEQIQQGRLLRKVKKDYPRLALNWIGIGIICIAAGYLLWSTYIHMVQPKANSEDSSNKKISPSPSVPSASSIEASSEVEEKEKIIDLLEKIKRANLEKDIHLFLFCYAKDYKDREGKKRSTLESWENFNFLDLTFNLESFALTGNIARARVAWSARFTPKGGGPPQESQTNLDVVFKKEEGNWKIAEIKSRL